MSDGRRSSGQSGQEAPSALARLTLTFGAIVFLHAGYSTYETISVQKAVGLPGTDIPSDIKVETLIGLLLIVVGAILTASPLRKITWASEYRKQTIDQIDARSNFVTLNHRGPILFGAKEE